MAAPNQPDRDAAIQRLTSPIVARLLALTPEQREQVLRSLPRRVQSRLMNTWELWARPTQVYRPGPHMFDAVLGGRGGGKSSTGANATIYVSKHTELCGGRNGRGGINAIVGRTFADVHKDMITGQSGILRWCPRDFRPRYLETKKELRWPNGCITRIFTGDEPASFRGPNIGWLWADELAHWIKLEASWSAAIGMLRLGKFPRALITTTPTGVQTLLEIIFDLIDGTPYAASEGTADDRQLQGFTLNPSTRVTTISMWDNVANLPAEWIEQMVRTHTAAGTGPQELEGYVEIGSPNAVWQYRWIRRIADVPEDDPLDAITVAVDPAATAAPTSAEWGVVVVAIGRSGTLYLLADLSGHLTPSQASAKIEFAAKELHATRLAYEDNQGGDLVEAALRPAMDPVVWAKLRKVRMRATRDKGTRAAIVAPLWEVGRVQHVGDARAFTPLEYQMRNFDPSKPHKKQPSDRMDALVWGVLDLVAGGSDRKAIAALGNRAAWDHILAEVRRRIA